MKETRKIILTALFISMGIFLPILIHFIPQGGKVLLPMHIPVILCGLYLGAKYGLICGILTPLISSVFTGMPEVPILPGMICELAVYGLICGLLINRIKSHYFLLKIYGSMLPAMLCGRLAAGLINTYIVGNGTQTLWAYLTASIITGAPGIILQLILIPALIALLMRDSAVKLRHS